MSSCSSCCSWCSTYSSSFNDYEDRATYAYKQLTYDDIRDLLQYKMLTCRFCQQMIIHPQVSLTACTQCNTVLGHANCVSMYRLNHDDCPVCKK